MISKIDDFAPQGVEAGVGLALQDDAGRYLFFLAGTRHNCPPGEILYAGIGGHREGGEDWLACAQREALEEIGVGVEILPAERTWYLPLEVSVQCLEITDRPRPLALYEMIHPQGIPRAGGLYRIVIYRARLHDVPHDLPPEELLGVIAMTAEQVIKSLDRKPTLDELVEEGAEVVAGGEQLDGGVRLYPFGTAIALAHILRHTENRKDRLQLR
jgi:8-oxo-dGTP pyrophosphatase MutT (NUDIX family)